MRTPALLPLIALASACPAQTVAHWRFDEGVDGQVAEGVGAIEDSAGSHDGTPVGGPEYRDSTLGHGRALLLDAVDDRVAVPDSPEFSLTEAFTLEAYIRIESIQWPLVQVLFRGDNRAGCDPWYLALLADAHPVLSIDDGQQIFSLVGPDSLPFNKWLHLAGVFDSSEHTLRLFVNGVEVAEATTTLAPIGELTGRDPGVGIGNLQNRWHQNFGGQLDEVRISSSALPPAEFLPPPCPVDLTGDGRDDTRDVLVFVNRFASGDSRADWNGDGRVDTRDLTAFLNAWAGGCV